MTVEVDGGDYELDAILSCGERLSIGRTTVPAQLVIVAVLSPGTGVTDRA